LRRVKHVKMGGVIESDEVYVTAGLKGGNSSQRIGRRVSEGSTVYTEFFKSYLGLCEA